MLVMSLRYFDSPDESPSLELLESYPGVGMFLSATAGVNAPSVLAVASVDSALLPPGGLYGLRFEFADFNIDRVLPTDGDQPSYIYVSLSRPSDAFSMFTVEQAWSKPYGPPWHVGSTSPVVLPLSGPLIMAQSVDEVQWTSSGVLVNSEAQTPLPVEPSGAYEITAFCTAKLDGNTRYPAYTGVLDVYLEPIGGEAAAFWTDFNGCYEAR